MQQQPVSNQYAAAYTPTYPQPQYAHQSPHSSTADIQASQNSGRTTPTYPQAQQPEVPDILSQLVSAGLIPAGRQGVGAGGGLSRPGQKTQAVVLPLVLNLSKAKVILLLQKVHMTFCSICTFHTGGNLSCRLLHEIAHVCQISHSASSAFLCMSKSLIANQIEERNASCFWDLVFCLQACSVLCGLVHESLERKTYNPDIDYV